MPKEKRKIGFAALSRKRLEEIGRMGGLASQKAGAGHQWDSEEAALAGAASGRSKHQARLALEKGKTKTARAQA